MVLVYLFKDILCKSTFLKLKYLSRKQYKFFNIILLFSLSKSNPKFSTFKISGFKLFKYFGGRFRSLECLFNKLKINSIKCLKIFLILKIILQTHYSFILKSASYDTSTSLYSFCSLYQELSYY
jgi:flagellar biosynthesis protein FlhB